MALTAGAHAPAARDRSREGRSLPRAARPACRGGGTLRAAARHAGNVYTDRSMPRLCLASQPWVRAEAEDATVGFQLVD